MNYGFQRFQRHVHTYRILPDADGLLAVQVSPPQSTYTHTTEKESKEKVIDVGNVCANSNTFSFVRTAFLPCGCALVAQALQHRGEIVFYVSEIPGQPTHSVTLGEALFVAVCVYTRVFVLDIMRLLDVAV